MRTQDTIQQINQEVQTGFDQFDPDGWYHKTEIMAACDRWLQAWALVKELITPEMRRPEDLNATYRDLEQPLYHWLSELEMHLHNAGIEDPRYFEERIRFVREQLAIFPDLDENSIVNLRRAEGEALWQQGRQAEAEAVYQALVEQLPDQAWGYIGWSDQYYLGPDRPNDYVQAEAILQQALARPDLDDHRSVVERLVGLYDAWGQLEKMKQLVAEYEAEAQRLLVEKARLEQETETLKKLNRYQAQKQPKPGRNDPCWCGSGKKYKQCHWKSDRQ